MSELCTNLAKSTKNRVANRHFCPFSVASKTSAVWTGAAYECWLLALSHFYPECIPDHPWIHHLSWLTPHFPWLTPLCPWLNPHMHASKSPFYPMKSPWNSNMFDLMLKKTPFSMVKPWLNQHFLAKICGSPRSLLEDLLGCCSALQWAVNSNPRRRKDEKNKGLMWGWVKACCHDIWENTHSLARFSQI